MACILFIFGGVVGSILAILSLILGVGPLAALVVWSAGGLLSIALLLLLAPQRRAEQSITA